MPPAGFDPTISADERQLSYALDRAATLLQLTVYNSVRYTYFTLKNCPKSFYMQETNTLRSRFVPLLCCLMMGQ